MPSINAKHGRRLLVLWVAVLPLWEAGVTVARGGTAPEGLLERLGLRMEGWQRPNACGPNCLFVFLRLQGHRITHEEVLAGVATGDQGVSLASLKAYSVASGVPAEVVFTTPAALAEVPLPAIAHVGADGGSGHFVLVSSVAGDQVSVVDGGTGERKTIGRAAFERAWSGYLLVPAPQRSLWPWGALLPAAAALLVFLTFFGRRSSSQGIRS